MKLAYLHFVVLLAGCVKAAPPAAPPASLVGLSVDTVTSRMGKPDTTLLGTFQTPVAAFGPTPQLLKDGDTYYFLLYNNYAGRQLHLWAVDPATYQRVYGTLPGSDPYYVVEVADFEAGTVF